HKSAFAYGDAWQDGGVGADGDAVFDHGWHYVPVRVRLRKSVAACGAWVNVVGEHDAVADEDTVTNRHAFADEGVAGNLAVAADSGILLDFDEGANAGAGADAATVKVDKIGVGNDHAFVQLDIRCDHAAPPSFLSDGAQAAPCQPTIPWECRGFVRRFQRYPHSNEMAFRRGSKLKKWP